jgi:hypothetical protein
MIATIGSLVQETSRPGRWRSAVALYLLGCVSTASALGASLSLVGHLVRRSLCAGTSCSGGSGKVSLAVGGFLALGYGLSDLGVLRLPRPVIMYAVPVTWWRRWQPYGAALVYGAALGLGITTRIPFGAFYVLCGWCALQGNVLYGALLLGSYGIARGLALLPASWTVYHRSGNEACERAMSECRLVQLGSHARRVRVVVAAGLLVFGAQLLLSSVL